MFSQANDNIDIDLYMANKYRIKPSQNNASRSIRQQDQQFFQYLRAGRYKQAYIFGQQIMNKRPNNKSIPNFLTYIQLNMLHVDQEEKQSTSEQSEDKEENDKQQQQDSEQQSQDDNQQDSESDEQTQIQATQNQLQSKQEVQKNQNKSNKINRKVDRKRYYIKSQNRQLLRKQQIANKNKDLLKQSTQISQKQKYHDNNRSIGYNNHNALNEKKKLSLKHPIDFVRESKTHNKTVIPIGSNKHSNHFDMNKNSQKPIINVSKFKQNEEPQQIPKLSLGQQGNTIHIQKQQIQKELLKNIINIKLNQESEYARQRRKTNIPTNNKKCIKLPWITNNNTTNFNQTLFNSAKLNQKQTDKQKISKNQQQNKENSTNVKNVDKQNRKIEKKVERRSQIKLSYQKRHSQGQIIKIK